MSDDIVPVSALVAAEDLDDALSAEAAEDLENLPKTPMDVFAHWLSEHIVSEDSRRAYRDAIVAFAQYRRRTKATTRDEKDAAAAKAALWLLSQDPVDAYGVVMAWRNRMAAQGLAPRTINHRIAALSSLVNAARTANVIDWTLNVKGLRIKVDAYKDTSIPKLADLHRIIEAITAPRPVVLRDRAIQAVAALGYSPERIAGLDLRDVRLDRSEIGSRGKVVQLDAAAAHALAEWLAVRDNQAGPLFRSMRRGAGEGRLTVRGVRTILGDPARAEAMTGKDRRDLAVLRLLTDLALRRSSVCLLDIDAINLAAGEATVPLKGRAEPVVKDLPDPTAAALREWLSARGDRPGPLFLDLSPALPARLARREAEVRAKAAREGVAAEDIERDIAAMRTEAPRLTTHGLAAIVRERGAAVGVKRLHPHSIRRAIGTAIAQTEGVLIARDALNHRSIATTNTYLMVSRAAARAGARRAADLVDAGVDIDFDPSKAK